MCGYFILKKKKILAYCAALLGPSTTYFQEKGKKGARHDAEVLVAE